MMSPPRHSNDPTTATRRRVIRVLALLCAMGNSLAMAGEQVLVEGILDAELHKFNEYSFSPFSSHGDIFTLGQLQLWSAWQISPGFQVYALGEIATVDSGGNRKTDAQIQQAALRYSSNLSNAGNSSAFYFIEAGKIVPPIVTASERRLSTQNPLIGQPDLLYAQYPLGIQVAGSSGWLDYRAALVDLPPIDPEYLPSDPGSALRPDVGFGITPLTGLRLGVAYTKGPYLNNNVNADLPPGSGWKDYDQRVWGLEFQFSSGYAELNSELVFTRYDVPFQAERTDVMGYFVEFKYTLTPRFYCAFRLERNEYPLVYNGGASYWFAQKVTIHDVEIGLGYRFSPDTQLKLAFRHDYGDEAYDYGAYGNEYSGAVELYPLGNSLSLQLSHHFDLMSWLLTER
jgi:Phosphate-selective porin O and P